MRRSIVLAALALMLASCYGAIVDSNAPQDIAGGGWTTHAPMPTARQEVAVATVGDRVFVIGGFADRAEAVGTVETYHPATNTWDTRASVPVALHHAAAAVVDGRLFIVGGYTGGRIDWTAQRSVYEFDVARNSWATRSPMPTARGGLAAAVLTGRIHAIGGSTGSASDAHEVYDPATDRWTRMAPMPTARDHLAAVAFQGRLWAIGGRSSFIGTQYPNVDIYDADSDRWFRGPPLPAGRGGIAAAVLGNHVFVFGGEAPLRIFNATEMWEASANGWIAKASMPTPRHGIGAAVVGDRIYIPGGGTEPGYARTNVNESYRP